VHKFASQKFEVSCQIRDELPADYSSRTAFGGIIG